MTDAGGRIYDDRRLCPGSRDRSRTRGSARDDFGRANRKDSSRESAHADPARFVHGVERFFHRIPCFQKVPRREHPGVGALRHGPTAASGQSDLCLHGRRSGVHLVARREPGCVLRLWRGR